MAQMVDHKSICCCSSGVEHVLGKELLESKLAVYYNKTSITEFLIRIITGRVVSYVWIKNGSVRFA